MSDFNYQKLKEIRTSHGMTQAEMAKTINVARTTYADYEKGRISPSLGKMQYICARFNIEINELISGERYKEASDMMTRLNKVVLKDLETITSTVNISELSAIEKEAILSVINLIRMNYKKGMINK